MNIEETIQRWFTSWENGDFLNLPISDNFKHTSPFGKIEGKKAYIDLVEKNRDKFLGYRFEIHDMINGQNKSCVRYTAIQGEEFRLDVSEWHYLKNNLIEEIVAYYHIGEIRQERQLKK